MFGAGKHEPQNDKLNVQVHAVAHAQAFEMAQKLWAENARTFRLDAETGKEFLHFAYTNPACVVWLQRDQGRTDAFELIIRWEDAGAHEVFVLSGGPPAGDGQRVTALLERILTTPSVVPSTQ